MCLIVNVTDLQNFLALDLHTGVEPGITFEWEIHVVSGLPASVGKKLADRLHEALDQ